MFCNTFLTNLARATICTVHILSTTNVKCQMSSVSHRKHRNTNRVAQMTYAGCELPKPFESPIQSEIY